MVESKENISTSIVERKTGGILRKLAPELGIAVPQVLEITSDIVDGLLKYKSIDKIAVIKVAEAVAPQLPMLGEKLYDSLKLCSEEERKMIVRAITLTILGAAGIKYGTGVMVQHERTQRVEIVCDLIKNFSPAEIIKSWWKMGK